MTRRTWTGTAMLAALLAVGAIGAGCGGSDGDDGRDGATGPIGPQGPPAPTPPPEPTDPNLGVDEDLPGVDLTVTGLAGATGAGGQFQVGDTLSVTFTVAKGDGSYLGLDELDYGRIYMSGPTTNYQRVLPSVSNLRAASVKNPDGSYTYTFAAPIPAVYAAPLSDSAFFDADDGELTGQPLLPGTYTVGVEVNKNYFVGDETFLDPANATRDFLFGTAAVLAPREVVTRANCNQCHNSLVAHSGRRTDPKLCVLCHTAGSEDNDPLAVTTGVTLEFKVMIHRLHNGEHLPSVLGVGTNADGSRNYGLTPKPLQYMDGDEVVDFTEVAFPVWPNLNIVMPRDAGYSALTTAQKAQEDEIRRGVTACAKCHGDPDGTGPLAAPAQGGNAYSNQSRRACGSCHDDVDWTVPYVANGVSMPAQATDANCLTCHPVTGGSLASTDAHVHPLKDPVFNPGLNFDITAVTDGSGNLNGKLDPGEKIQVTFTLKNDAGTDVPASSMSSMTALVNGPTTNKQQLLVMGVPVAYLGAGPTYTVNLPQTVQLDYAGTGSAAAGEVFLTSRSPHWNVAGGTTTVYTAAATATATTLAAAAPALQNFVDVASSAGFLRNDYVVIEGGTGNREYLRIQTVEGNRLWFNSIGSLGTYQPFLRSAHLSGVTVTKVTLTAKTLTTHYTLVAATGAVTEVADSLGSNDVVVTYTSDYLLPAVYPAPYNDTPTLDETWGEWAGKSLVDGTYTVALYGVVSRTFSQSGENTSYSGTSQGVSRDFLVGAATEVVPYAVISAGTNCYRCHNDLYFHGGGRRGFDTCINCHGSSGFEDRPQYVAPNAPATARTPVSYRTMLHKIHRGADLPDASTYTIVGFGSGTYPNNYGAGTFETIEFPAMPGGVRNCFMCHGATNTTWQGPSDRSHPTQQGMAARTWRATCGACHSSASAQAHIDAMTAVSATGAESCAVCHGQDRPWAVQRMHKTR